MALVTLLPAPEAALPIPLVATEATFPGADVTVLCAATPTEVAMPMPLVAVSASALAFGMIMFVIDDTLVMQMNPASSTMADARALPAMAPSFVAYDESDTPGSRCSAV